MDKGIQLASAVFAAKKEQEERRKEGLLQKRKFKSYG